MCGCPKSISHFFSVFLTLSEVPNIRVREVVRLAERATVVLVDDDLLAELVELLD